MPDPVALLPFASAAPLPLAHAGHTALWVLYAAPVVAVLVAVVVSSVRERRRRADLEAEPEADEGEKGSHLS